MIPKIARAVPELALNQAGLNRTPHESSNLSRCGTKPSPHPTEELGNGHAVVDATSQNASRELTTGSPSGSASNPTDRTSPANPAYPVPTDPSATGTTAKNPQQPQ